MMWWYNHVHVNQLRNDPSAPNVTTWLNWNETQNELLWRTHGTVIVARNSRRTKMHTSNSCRSLFRFVFLLLLFVSKETIYCTLHRQQTTLWMNAVVQLKVWGVWRYFTLFPFSQIHLHVSFMYDIHSYNNQTDATRFSFFFFLFLFRSFCGRTWDI